jgi:hypothetical protein
MDGFAYRARRILPSMIAWLLAAGRPYLIFNAYSIVNVIAWLALSAVLWHLLEVRDTRTWIAWFGILFSAGAMFSVRRALTDLVALAFIAGALLLATRRRRVASAISLSAAALCRETSILAAVDFLWRGSGSSPRKGRLRNYLDAAALCCLSAAPLLLWMIYVRYRAGTSPGQLSNFTWPFLGLAGQWGASLKQIMHANDMILSVTSILALLGLTAQALYFTVTIERENRWWRLGATYLVLMAFLNTPVWEGFPSAACRVLLPMTLAFNLLVTQRRAPLAWLLIGNLGVFSGLLFMRDVPHHDAELSASATMRGAGFVTRGPGSYGPEYSSTEMWLWSPQTAEFSISCWPRSSPDVGFQFKILSVAPTVVTISSGGTVLWSHMVGMKDQTILIRVPLSHGHADLEFAAAGKPIIPHGDNRPLNFAVYNPKIVLTGTH